MAAKGEIDPRKLLDNYIKKGRYVGIQYMVIDCGGEVRFEYNGGMRDIASADEVTAQTNFMCASMTKVITSLGILLLVDDNVIDLDDPLNKYYDGHSYGTDITIRQLLNHTSGVPNPIPLNWIHTFEEHPSFDENSELMKQLRTNARVQSQTGSRFLYSNLGYWLLGKVIENCTGSSYEDFIRRRIFEPLNIPQSEMSFEFIADCEYAVGYVKQFSVLRMLLSLMAPKRAVGSSTKGWTSFNRLYMNGKPYGGLMGTCRGWSKILFALLNEESDFISDNVRKLLFDQQTTSDGQKIDMALGWHMIHTADGRHSYQKVGGGPGFCGNVRLYQSQGFASVWLSNTMDVNSTSIESLSREVDLYFM